MNLSNVQYISFNDNNNNVDVSGQLQRCKRMNCLYEKYKNDFSTYLIKHKHTLRLLLNNSTLRNITAYDYMYNTCNNYALTPLPYKSMRKFHNERDKKEFKRIERNAVMMRRIEYTHKIKESKLKEKYGSNVHWVIYIQKIVRGYFMRKVIECVYMIKLQIQRFILHIKLYAVISRNRKRKEIRSNKGSWSLKGNMLFEKKVQNIIIGNNKRNSNGKWSMQRLNKSCNYNNKGVEGNSKSNVRKKYFNAKTEHVSVNESMLKQNKRKCYNNSISNSNNISCKCYSLYSSPNRPKQCVSRMNCSSNNNNQSKSNCSMISYTTKSPDKQSVYNNTHSNKEGIILLQNISITNNDDNGDDNDNINIIPSPKSQNSNEDNDIHNNISKLPSLNVNNTNISNSNTTTNNNHSLSNNTNNHNKDVQPQCNANEISIEHSNKIKLIQNAYRNYLFHKRLTNNNNTTHIKHTYKYSSNIFNFSVNNPSVEALNNNNKEKLSSQAILDSHDINLKDETYLNGVQFDSNNNIINIDNFFSETNNNNTTEENTETIPDNYELTQQRADKLFPLFTSIANDISLLYRINKITQTQQHKHKEHSSSHYSNDIIENDSEVFN